MPSTITPLPVSPALEPPAPLPTAEVLGIPLALADYERTMDWMDGMVAARAKGYVTAAAVHLVMVAREDPDTRGAVLGADARRARRPAARVGAARAWATSSPTASTGPT